MPQELRVVRCYTCETFQVDIVKKSCKWQCKMCGEKQSVTREYGRGSGKDCRIHVQRLNELRRLKNESPLNFPATSETDNCVSYQDMGEQSSVSTCSKWSEFVENNGNNSEDEGERNAETNDFSQKTVLKSNFLQSPRKCFDSTSTRNNSKSMFLPYAKKQKMSSFSFYRKSEDLNFVQCSEMNKRVTSNSKGNTSISLDQHDKENESVVYSKGYTNMGVEDRHDNFCVATEENIKENSFLVKNCKWVGFVKSNTLSDRPKESDCEKLSTVASRWDHFEVDKPFDSMSKETIKPYYSHYEECKNQSGNINSKWNEFVENSPPDKSRKGDTSNLPDISNSKWREYVENNSLSIESKDCDIEKQSVIREDEGYEQLCASSGDSKWNKSGNYLPESTESYCGEVFGNTCNEKEGETHSGENLNIRFHNSSTEDNELLINFAPNFVLGDIHSVTNVQSDQNKSNQSSCTSTTVTNILKHTSKIVNDNYDETQLDEILEFE